MNFKIVIALGAVILSFIGIAIGDFISQKKCNEAIDLAIEAAQTDFQLQLEQANSQNQKVVIKTIKQNETIKKAVSSYDIVQRVRLLAQIENFEAGR